MGYVASDGGNRPLVGSRHSVFCVLCTVCQPVEFILFSTFSLLVFAFLFSSLWLSYHLE